MRKFILIISILATLPMQAAKPKALTDDVVRATMKKATEFMVEKVSNNGGYLWNYAPDFSRVWGELECKPSMMFYRWTGDTKYLARIPDALEFLDNIKYSPEEVAFFRQNLRNGQILCPTFVEVGTGNPLYLHRGNGKYWVDYDRNNLITHYRSYRTINYGSLKEQYEALLKMSVEEATADSPFLGDKARQRRYPAYYSSGSGVQENRERIQTIVDALADKPYWPGGLPSVSRENPGFSDAPLPAECISTWTYMQNMTHLINWLTVK